jgi:hypothetical protein
MRLCVFFRIKLLQYNELRETHGFFTGVCAVLLDFCVVFWYNTAVRVGGGHGETKER